MFDLSLLESCFEEYSRNLNEHAPDGIIEVDVFLLQRLGLLNWEEEGSPSPTSLTQHFQILESPSKITLINSDFVIWIVPELVNDEPKTFTLVAVNQSPHPVLELVFCNSGVYNSSRLVLRILERLLHEVKENEELLKTLN